MNIKIRHCLIIFVVALFVNILPASLGYLSADSCVYLDAGRNLFEGKGFTCSYNYYQYWAKEANYPCLQFLPPIFPIVAGFIWKMFHSLKMPAFFNVFLAAINCVIIYLILRSIYVKRLYLGFWAAIVVALSRPMQFTSIFAWTEQLHLLVLLIAIFIFVKNFAFKKCLIIGLLLGLGFLIKPATFYNLVAFLIVPFFARGLKKEALIMSSLIILGFLVLVLPYELFCITKYNVLYPEYIKAGDVFSQARVFGGYYADELPFLRAVNLTVLERWQLLSKNFLINLGLFIKTSWRYLGLLNFLFILQLFYLIRYNNYKELILLFVGAVNISFYSIGFYWAPIINIFEVTRFSLIHFVLFIPLGIAALFNISDFVKKKQFLRFVPFALLILVVLNMAILAFSFNRLYLTVEEHFQKRLGQRELFSWIRNNTATSALIATSEYQDAFELDRPIVSLPEGKMVTAKNMNKFLEIYSPRYMIISNRKFDIYRELLSAKKGEFYSLGNWKDYYIVFEPTKF